MNRIHHKLLNVHLVDMEWLNKNHRETICFYFFALSILFITRSTVGIGKFASVEVGDEEEVDALLDIVVLVAIIYLSGR